ncbi:acyl carrier protein [Desulfobacterota bacterium M19]
MDIEMEIKKIFFDTLGLASSGNFKSKDDMLLKHRIIDDLGADSLDAVELLVEVEDFFDIEFINEEAENCETVADVVELVKKAGKS